MVAEHPWEALPPEVADVLRPELPALADEIVAELSRGVPDYARPLEGPVRAGAAGPGSRRRSGGSRASWPTRRRIRDAGREVYLNLGRGEMRAGRSLDALLAAYRLGARVAWRRLAAAGERAGLSPRTLYTLAEAIFAYIDELSADSIEGYAREQAAAAGALQRRRQRLAALLVQDPPAAPATVEAAASNAGLAAAAQRLRAGRGVRREQRGRGAAGRPPRPGCAGRARRPPLNVALVPAPARPERARGGGARQQGGARPGGAVAGGRAQLRARPRGAAAGAARAASTATAALLVAERHRLSLLLGADRRLARDVAEAALAPLEAETELSRERLGSTLDAWLRHRGRTEAVAKALHVHPQTVRYRLARLRELFGSRLDDPDGRFELELALRARRIAG